MALYNVSYDLYQGNKNHNYDDLYNALKATGTWAKIVESTWLVETDESALDFTNRLLTHMDPQDRIAVMQVRGGVAWRGLGKKVEDWINSNVPT